MSQPFHIFVSITVREEHSPLIYQVGETFHQVVIMLMFTCKKYFHTRYHGFSQKKIQSPLDSRLSLSFRASHSCLWGLYLRSPVSGSVKDRHTGTCSRNWRHMELKEYIFYFYHYDGSSYSDTTLHSLNYEKLVNFITDRLVFTVVSQII